MQIPRGDEGLVCPLHRKDMSEVCHKCPWLMQVRGKNPQGEETMDQWRCAVALLPLLLIENAQMTRHTTAAVETMRNAIGEAVQLAADETQRRLLNGNG